MCDCISRLNIELEQCGENTMVSFTFTNPVRAMLLTLKRESGVRKRPKAVVATYCPFCGNRYEPRVQREEVR